MNYDSQYANASQCIIFKILFYATHKPTHAVVWSDLLHTPLRFQIPISLGSSSPMQFRDYAVILDRYVSAWVWTALVDKQPEGQSCEYTHTNTQRRPLFVQETRWSRISKRDAAGETDKQWRGDRMRVRERYRTLGRQRPKDGVKKRKIKIEMRKKDSDIERLQRYADSFWSEVRRGLSLTWHTHSSSLTVWYKMQCWLKSPVLFWLAGTHF